MFFVMSYNDTCVMRHIICIYCILLPLITYLYLYSTNYTQVFSSAAKRDAGEQGQLKRALHTTGKCALKHTLDHLILLSCIQEKTNVQ